MERWTLVRVVGVKISQSSSAITFLMTLKPSYRLFCPYSISDSVGTLLPEHGLLISGKMKIRPDVMNIEPHYKHPGKKALEV